MGRRSEEGPGRGVRIVRGEELNDSISFFLSFFLFLNKHQAYETLWLLVLHIMHDTDIAG